MKKSMVICAPVTSRSGYGDHARDLVTSLIEHNKYDIKIQDVPWGDCPRNTLKINNDDDKKILDCIIKPGDSISIQPDVYVDIRIPNEFQRLGKFNIGITAGIETNAVSQVWLDGCNRMDLIIVPSQHSKDGFVNALYEKLQQTPDGKRQKVGELKLDKPIEVLFEGSKEDIYKPLKEEEINDEFLEFINNKVEEDFCFLHVGMWGKGGMGEDRKDISNTIKIFYESFANKKIRPALIIKTSGATSSIMDREQCLSKIKEIKKRFPSDWKLPNVYLLHGDLTDVEMNYLYNHPKIKSFVSFTHGEGYGRPLQEASMVGLPVMASGWSGHIDFLDADLSLLLPGKLEKVPETAVWENIIIAESSWFKVESNSAYKGFNILFGEYDYYKEKAKKLMKINRDKFTLNKMTIKFDEIMEKYLKDQPQKVSLKLPKLKKVKETI